MPHPNDKKWTVLYRYPDWSADFPNDAFQAQVEAPSRELAVSAGWLEIIKEERADGALEGETDNEAYDRVSDEFAPIAVAEGWIDLFPPKV